MLHAFSGFRRFGDIQHEFLQAFISTAYTVVMVSIDVSVRGCHLDFFQEDTVSFWAELIRNGRFFSFSSSSPRET